MLARGHKLKVGQVGIVGYVAGTGQPRIALDVGADAVFFDNPDLPHTRSEMALPLKVRDQVIGVLDVQSTQEAAFSAEDMTILQTLADQVTLAIENARLFADSQETLGTLRRAYSELSREAWVNLLRARRGIGYQADRSGVSKLEATTPETWEAEAQCAWQMGQTIQERSDRLVAEPALALPIRVRGEIIGVLDACKPDAAGEWTAEEIQLLETLSDQLGLALDSARLYQDTQRRAAQEQLVGEVTARMRETLEMDTVLRTAVREIGEALGIPEVEVRLARGGVSESLFSSASGNGHGKEEGAAA